MITGSKLQGDLVALMASVMAIKSEVFGRCVEEIDVYVDVKYEGG